jgi:hypothetical protein
MLKGRVIRRALRPRASDAVLSRGSSVSIDAPAGRVKPGKIDLGSRTSNSKYHLGMTNKLIVFSDLSFILKLLFKTIIIQNVRENGS